MPIHLPPVDPDNPKIMPTPESRALCDQIFREIFGDAQRRAIKRAAWIQKHRVADGIVRPKIYVYWGQGFHNSPAVVQRCKYEMQRFECDSDIAFLDDTNWCYYVDIPHDIMKSFSQNKVAFSDLLRVELLSKFGGIWADATCYVSRNLTSQFNRMVGEGGLFVFNKGTGNRGDISNWFLAARAGSYPMCLMREMLISYWKQYERPVHYFFFHQFFRRTYARDADFRKVVDLAPDLGWDPRAMKAILLENYGSVSLEAEIEKSPVHKLSYKLPQNKINSKTILASFVRGP